MNKYNILILSGILKMIRLNSALTHSLSVSLNSPSPRLNSPNCPVRPGADRAQLCVSLRDVPRRFLDLQSLKTRSNGRLLHWRLHGGFFFGFPGIKLSFFGLSTWWQVSPGYKGRRRTKRPRKSSRHMTVGRHSFRITAVKTWGPINTVKAIL